METAGVSLELFGTAGCFELEMAASRLALPPSAGAITIKTAKRIVLVSLRGGHRPSVNAMHYGHVSHFVLPRWIGA